ncbi:MAG: TolC family protein [Gemmatimonadetes bacterium]|nr:TolC family protein [Gemmatimonadota bacterium]
MEILGSLVVALLPAATLGQPVPSPLRLAEARRLAQEYSAEQAAAAASVAADRARARQLGALANPVFQLRREDTGADHGGTNQIVLELSQPFDWARAARARSHAASARADAASHAARAGRASLDLDVIDSYYRAVAADAGHAVLARTIAAFDRAAAISERRLSAGDVSGLAHRRLTLEAARFAAASTRLALEGGATRRRLASLIGRSPEGLVLADTLPWPALPVGPAVDSIDLAYRRRPKLAALEADLRAAERAAAAERRGRLPVPVLTAGLKSESVGRLSPSPGRSLS